MKIEIVNRKVNALLKREEIELKVEHAQAATPSRAALLPEIVKLLKVDPKLVIIDKIFTHSGLTTARVMVELYKKAEDIPPAKLTKSAQRIKEKGEEKESAREEGKKEKEAGGKKEMKG